MAQIHVRRGDRVVDGAQRRPTPVKHGLTLLAPQQMGSICCSEGSGNVPLETPSSENDASWLDFSRKHSDSSEAAVTDDDPRYRGLQALRPREAASLDRRCFDGVYDLAPVTRFAHSEGFPPFATRALCTECPQLRACSVD
jgi:hypothetical protein